ncbi:MAG: pyrrolo-quinoline quinone, partial [Acidobacteria bacterium]|nr:pyrrolo-quinoline quinone [Acidobacteriota bacterium]
MRRLLLVLFAVLLASPSAALAQGGGLDPASLLAPLENSWPTYSGDYSGRRYSMLTQV